MKGVIYQITNIINNKIYIGQTINPNKRWQRHRNDAFKMNTVLARAMRKYGIENFKFDIIEKCDENKLNDREIYWIDIKKSCVLDGKNGYNMTRGGEDLKGDSNPFYGHTHNEETKKQLSIKASKRTGEKNPFFGKCHSDESKEKSSNSHKGKKFSEEVNKKKGLVGDKNAFYGKTHSDESKRKISESRLGKLPHNAIPYYALNDDKSIELYFQSMGQILQYLKECQIVGNDYTMSKLKNKVKKSLLKNVKEFGYYWVKSVETTEKISI